MNLSERYREKLSYQSDLQGELLQMEVTNACNHRCVFCPNSDSKRPKRMMDFGFAKRIITESAELLGKEKKICFHMNGEPLLYERLADLVAFSKQMGYGYAFITTNGAKASEEKLTGLFEAGLDSIKFSINAGDRETYRKIHGADDFGQAINALKFSYRYRKEHNKAYKIFVSCVGTVQNYHELESFNEFASQYCDEVLFYYPCAYAGQKLNAVKELRCGLEKLHIKTFDIKHTAPCPVLWNSINVTCEGYLALCCSEANNRLVIEDLNKMSVRDAWLGERMNAIRNKHRKGDIADTPCLFCITEKEYDGRVIDGQLFGLAYEAGGRQ